MTGVLPATDRAGDWPSGTMTAVAVTGHGKAEVLPLPVPEPLPGHVLVRVTHTGLCGTDLELLHGTASYLLDGRASLPHVVGHEWTGTVAAADTDTGLLPGQRVVGQTMVPCGRCRHCRGGQRGLCPAMHEVGLYGLQGAAASYVRMPASALVPVPDAVDDRSAVLVEPAVTVVEALRRADCRAEDRVAVVGTGTIGLIAVQLAARQAHRVDAVGIEPAGLELAVSLGAREGLTPEKAPDARYSLVIEASGSPAGFGRAVELAQPGGRIAAVGVAAGPVDGVPAARITLDGLSVLGVRHGLDHYDHVLDLLADGVLRAEPLISRVLPAARAAEAFELLEHGRGARPKVLLDFTEADAA